jgi:hypothetical protein
MRLRAINLVLLIVLASVVVGWLLTSFSFVGMQVARHRVYAKVASNRA